MVRVGMISYDLRCAKDHVFEAWFRNSDAYGEQVKKKAVACPVCGSTKVEKTIMAPRIAKGESGGSDEVSPGAMKQMLVKMRETVEENCDYVGSDFPEEARKIHYGETGKRSIYGEASDKEAKELTDEGVPVTAIPWIPSTDS